MNGGELAATKARQRRAAQFALKPEQRARLRSAWRNHGVALLIYAFLSVALSWPTIRNVTTLITTSGVDAKHNLWTFWHTQQVLLGRQPLFDAPYLYYPRGISLLVHGVGPVTGLFALPFWWLGPEAAYNGALLVSLCLSGYCTYLLARGLDFERAIAIFAGMMALASPIALAGLNNHVTKVFLGAIPLALLALHHALDLERSRWWALLVGPALLLLLWHTGYQFVFTTLAVGFLTLVALIDSPAADRWRLLPRILLMAASVLVVVGPMLYAITVASHNPAISVDVNDESFVAPELLQYLLPSHISLLFGGWVQNILQPYVKAKQAILNSETAVSLALAGVLLCVVAAVNKTNKARRWLVLLVLCILCSFGPVLHAGGRTEFTQYKLPIIMPYAFVTELPGLGFMRAPGRFMMLGFVLFAICASFGLALLTQRFPRWRRVIIVAAAALVLAETWPQPFPQERLPAVPAFYQQLANDPEQYGVFDLPLKPASSLTWNWTTVYYSSFYQIFQMTHHKGIASGYISRTYATHPLFSGIMEQNVSHLLINDQPAAYADFKADLARNNYRYVVLHKQLFADIKGGNQAVDFSKTLLHDTFGAQPPLVDDAQVTVYRVAPSNAAASIRWGEHWRDAEQEWRWATGAATVQISAAQPQHAILQITPALIHDPHGKDGLGEHGVLDITIGAVKTSVPITVGETADVPLTLAQGEQTVTLALQAGSFRPKNSDDDEKLSFAVRAINLKINQ